VIAALLFVITGLAAGPAFAHATLVSSSPADGAALSTGPTEVVFTFDEDLLPDTVTISINDEQGAVVATLKVLPSRNSLTVPWPAALPPATYQVAYRVASQDGHPVAGAISFSFAAVANPTAAGTPSPPPTSTAAATPGPTDAASAAAPAAGLSQGTLLAIGGVMLLGVAAAAGVLAFRRRP
jgi:methionine-rich copper-binding protein CopC